MSSNTNAEVDTGFFNIILGTWNPYMSHPRTNRQIVPQHINPRVTPTSTQNVPRRCGPQIPPSASGRMVKGHH